MTRRLTKPQCDKILSHHPQVEKTEAVYALVRHVFQIGHSIDVMKIEFKEKGTK